MTTQVTFPLLEASKGSIQAGDQGQEAEVAKDKGKGKGTKTEKDDPQAKDIPTSQLSQKEGPPKAKK